MSSPARQARHSPHVMNGCTITVSPTSTLVTPEPTSCTQPAFSCPGVYGSSTPDFSAHCPSWMCRSVRHSPAAPMRTTTSSGPLIFGSSTSSSFERLVVRVQACGHHAATSSASSTLRSGCAAGRGRCRRCPRGSGRRAGAPQPRAQLPGGIGAPSPATNAGASGSCGEAELARAARRSARRPPCPAGRPRAAPRLLGLAPPASSASHTRPWRASSALRWNSSRSASSSPVGLARERRANARAAPDGGVDLRRPCSGPRGRPSPRAPRAAGARRRARRPP